MQNDMKDILNTLRSRIQQKLTHKIITIYVKYVHWEKKYRKK